MSFEIDTALQAMRDLCRFIPPGGLKDRERVEKDMEEMISRDYEPYFSGNAAMHLLAECRDAADAAGRRRALPST